jgi:hypothetical protein
MPVRPGPAPAPEPARADFLNPLKVFEETRRRGAGALPGRPGEHAPGLQPVRPLQGGGGPDRPPTTQTALHKRLRRHAGETLEAHRVSAPADEMNRREAGEPR